MNSNVRRTACLMFFLVFGIGTASAGEELSLVKFVLQILENGRICATPQLEIKKWSKGFPPVIVLRHQVVKATLQDDGVIIEAVGGIGESVLPIPSKDFTIKYCFNTLKAGHYQLTSWHLLYAGKPYELLFDNGNGGVSNEILWDAAGRRVTYGILRKELPPLKKNMFAA